MEGRRNRLRALEFRKHQNVWELADDKREEWMYLEPRWNIQKFPARDMRAYIDNFLDGRPIGILCGRRNLNDLTDPDRWPNWCPLLTGAIQIMYRRPNCSPFTFGQGKGGDFTPNFWEFIQTEYYDEGE